MSFHPTRIALLATLPLLLAGSTPAHAQSVGIGSPSHGELLLDTSAFYRGAPNYDVEVRGGVSVPTGQKNKYTLLVHGQRVKIKSGFPDAQHRAVDDHRARMERPWLRPRPDDVAVAQGSGLRRPGGSGAWQRLHAAPAGQHGRHALVSEPIVRTFWGADDSALDQSCLDPIWAADHNLVGSHPQVCYDTTYTQLNHVTTPAFARMDIDDPLGQQQYVFYGLYPTKDAYRTAQYDQLQLFATYGSGVGGLEPPDTGTGVQGPRCRRHVAIQTNDGFYRHAVSNPGVVGLPFYDLLVNWLANPAGPDTVQVQDDLAGAGSYTPSFCP